MHCDLLKVFNNGKFSNFYNIGSNKNLNNIEICKHLVNIAKKLINLGPNVKIKYIKDRPGHDLRYALNSDKIISKLKWNSKTDIIKGLKYTFQLFK